MLKLKKINEINFEKAKKISNFIVYDKKENQYDTVLNATFTKLRDKVWGWPGKFTTYLNFERMVLDKDNYEVYEIQNIDNTLDLITD